MVYCCPPGTLTGFHTKLPSIPLRPAELVINLLRLPSLLCACSERWIVCEPGSNPFETASEYRMVVEPHCSTVSVVSNVNCGGFDCCAAQNWTQATPNQRRTYNLILPTQSIVRNLCCLLRSFCDTARTNDSRDCREATEDSEVKRWFSLVSLFRNPFSEVKITSLGEVSGNGL